MQFDNMKLYGVFLSYFFFSVHVKTGPPKYSSKMPKDKTVPFCDLDDHVFLFSLKTCCQTSLFLKVTHFLSMKLFTPAEKMIDSLRVTKTLSSFRCIYMY